MGHLFSFLVLELHVKYVFAGKCLALGVTPFLVKEAIELLNEEPLAGV
jgi:hypothetical protein